MSGLVAVFLQGPTIDVASVVDKMSTRMKHRGDQCQKTSAAEQGNAAVVRYHSQGLFRAEVLSDTQRTIVFDGLLFNEEDLKQRAGTTTLTEAIWRGYARHGSDWLANLDGSFAVVIHDVRRDIFVAARDPFGHRPLVFALAQGSVLFGSEVKSLLAFPGLTRSLNTETLREVFHFGLVLGPETLIRDIYKVLPGHAAVIRNRSSIDHSMFYRPNTSVDETRTLRDIEEFVETSLSDTMEFYRSKTDRIGVLLSGGIDSVLMAGKLAEGGAGGHAVSFGATNWAEEESGIAGKIAADLGLPFTRALAGADFDALTYLRSSIWHIEEPTRFQNAMALEVALEASPNSPGAMLTGQGGNGYFGGRNHLIARYFPALKRVPYGLRKSLGKTFQRLPLGRLQRIGRYLETDSLESFLRRSLDYAPALSGGLPQSRIDRFTALEASFGHLDPVATFTLVLKIGIWYPWLERLEQIGSAYGFDMHHPLLRKSVLEYALTTPLRHKFILRGSVEKPALRNIAERMVGTEIAHAAKKQLTVPLPMWLEQSKSLQRAVMDLRDPECRFRKVIDSERADPFLDEFAKSGGTDKLTRQAVFILLSLEIWLELFLDEGPGRGC